MKQSYEQARRAFFIQLAQWQDSHIALCERCMMNPAIDIHHAAGREGGLLCDSAYFVGLCRSCHKWVTEHPAEAMAEGFSIERGR